MMKSYSGACAVEEETGFEELNYDLYVTGNELRLTLGIKFPNLCPVCKKRPKAEGTPHERFCALEKFYGALNAVNLEMRKGE